MKQNNNFSSIHVTHPYWTAILLTLILVFVFGGCTQSSGTIQATQVRPSPSSTIIPSTSTLTSTTRPTIPFTKTVVPTTLTLVPSATPTLAPTPLDTLDSAKADEVIIGLLNDPGDCIAPCFWGITPGKTTRDQANSFFFHLGASPYNTTIDGKDHASYEPGSKSIFSIGVLLTLQHNIVETQNIVLSVVSSNGITEPGWMSVSPKDLIQRYGKPSSVDFSWNLETGNLTFSIDLYFDDYDLIAYYHSPDGPDPSLSSPKICPLSVTYDYVWLWMGKNPYPTPVRGIFLDKGTSLTMDEFVSLMTGDVDHSCFNLNRDAFVPH